jgi:hypothetical protein
MCVPGLAAAAEQGLRQQDKEQTMYWEKLDAADRRALARHIYLAAVTIVDVEAAKIICADALDRAGGREGGAEQFAEQTYAAYVQSKIGMDTANPDEMPTGAQPDKNMSAAQPAR